MIVAVSLILDVLDRKSVRSPWPGHGTTIDTFEHAFYFDNQNRKADYVGKFIAHIDWLGVGLRFSSVSPKR